MVILDLFALLIGVLALLTAYFFLSKIGALLSKDKPRARRVIESVATGLLATILYVVVQKYIETIRGVPISLESGKLFSESLLLALGNLFISTAIMLAVVFASVYILLKPVMNKQGK